MWAIFIFLVLMMLLSALVAADATITTSGTIAAAPDTFLGIKVALPNAEVRHAKSVGVFTLAENQHSLRRARKGESRMGQKMPSGKQPPKVKSLPKSGGTKAGSRPLPGSMKGSKSKLTC